VPVREQRLVRRAGQLLPLSVRTRLWRLFVFRRPRWGNLRRTVPFSSDWGNDRGTPVDRFYIQRFLRNHAGDVRGDVLEIMGADYTKAFGDGRVGHSHVLDINRDNPAATIVGDLAEQATLPAERFDCFIVTQTVQLIADAECALANAFRSLRPGGVLLLTVPAISMLSRSNPDYRRYTPSGLERTFERILPAHAQVEIVAYGNVLAATAFLMGLAAEELSAEEPGANDPRCPVLVCARLRKPA
jgi:SAM-dependent methyltransferase